MKENIAIQIMNARRWDVEKMAKKFGVHISTVYRWRLGRLPPKGMAKHMLEVEYAKIEKKRKER